MIKVSTLLEKINKYVKREINSKYDKNAIFRYRAYSRLKDKIKNNFSLNDKVSYSQLVKKISLTKKMENHLKEIFDVKVDSDPKSKIINKLVSINGIGKVRAKELYEKEKVRKVPEDLIKKNIFHNLPNETKIFLSYNPLRKIPRQIIQKIEKEIPPPHELRKHAGTKNIKDWIIVGSYRRKKAFSSDIDLMIVSEDKNATRNFAQYLGRNLPFPFYAYNDGDDKVSGVLQVKTPKKEFVKFDIFRSSEKCAPFMLLYSTGSKDFNVKMRSKVKKEGYLLNQKGLFYKNNPTKKVKYNFLNEKSIFDFLKMKYVHPQNRY